MTDPLRELLDEMVQGQPPVSGWTAGVRQRVRARRRRQRVGTLAVAVALLAVGGSAVVLAGNEPAQEKLIAGPEPSASAAEPPPPAACPDTAPPPREQSLPPAQRQADGSYPRDSTMVVALDANCTTIRVGQRLLLRVTASGDSVTPSPAGMTLDGIRNLGPMAACIAGSDAPRPPEPGTRTEIIEHVYTEPKTDRISVTVGRQCSYYRGTATAELTVEVLPAEGQQPTAAPTPETAPQPSPEPSPEPDPPAPPAPKPEPSYPPSGTQVIEITAQGRPDRPTVGQEWVVDVTATGSADEPYLQEPCYDKEPCSRVLTSCVPRDANYSPPPPRPGKVQRTFRHTFTTPGRHEVRLEADSGCSYYQGRDELLVVVQVDPREPPSPSPSPS